MSTDENVIKFPKNFCWETNGQLAELVKQAEGALQYLEQNSVGYYYYWMLQELKKFATKASAVEQPNTKAKCIYDNEDRPKCPNEQPDGLASPDIAEGNLARVESELSEYLEGFEKLSAGDCKLWASKIMHCVIRPHLRQPEREAVTLTEADRNGIEGLILNALAEQAAADNQGFEVSSEQIDAVIDVMTKHYVIRRRG
jgi:hypothetical protein